MIVIGQAPLAKGFALGGLASAANFLIMAALLPRLLARGRGKAEAFSLFSILIRFAIMGAALVLAIKLLPRAAVGACAVGLFTVQITLIADRWLARFRPGYSAGSR